MPGKVYRSDKPIPLDHLRTICPKCGGDLHPDKSCKDQCETPKPEPADPGATVAEVIDQSAQTGRHPRMDDE